jgi:glucose-6-phosphate 1-dehydrogenase
MALVAMEAPSSLEDIRNEKLKVLRAVLEPKGHDSLAGQYDSYRDEPNVSPQSLVPTFGVAKFFIENWRWTGVPFYLRSGKALAEKTTRIIIQFKEVPHSIFTGAQPNRLVIKIEPEESIRLHFTAKVPGKDVVEDKNLLFQYNEARSDAYQRLLLDALEGRQDLFTTPEETEEGWRIIDPLVKHWGRAPLYRYEVGSWGPAMSNELLTNDRRVWL